MFRCQNSGGASPILKLLQYRFRSFHEFLMGFNGLFAFNESVQTENGPAISPSSLQELCLPGKVMDTFDDFHPMVMV